MTEQPNYETMQLNELHNLRRELVGKIRALQLQSEEVHRQIEIREQILRTTLQNIVGDPLELQQLEVLQATFASDEDALEMVEGAIRAYNVRQMSPEERHAYQQQLLDKLMSIDAEGEDDEGDSD